MLRFTGDGTGPRDDPLVWVPEETLSASDESVTAETTKFSADTDPPTEVRNSSISLPLRKFFFATVFCHRETRSP